MRDRKWNVWEVVNSVILVIVMTTASTDAADYLLVIDSSGSMHEKTANGQTKIQAAKQALWHLKDDLSAHNVGVILFGHTKNPKEPGACHDIEYALPIGPVADDSLDDVLERLLPKGNTPLAESLVRAKYIMQDRQSAEEKFIVVVTDGNETCGGDPVAEAAAIRELNMQVVTHVIGFGVDEQETTQLRGISTAGGDEFRQAADVDGLVRAIAIITGAVEAPTETSTTANYEYPVLSKVEWLLVARLEDADRGVRNQAARTLHERNSLAAVPFLIKRVADDQIYWHEDKEIPFAAVLELAPERVIETLLETTKSENPKVRSWATMRLGEHGGTASGDELNTVDRTLVELMLSDPDREVSNQAAQSLQARKVAAAIPQLIERIQDDRIYWHEDKDIPLAALRELAPNQVEDVLVGAMDSENAKVRSWAMERLVPQGG